MKPDNFTNNFYTIKPTKSEKVEVLYVEMRNTNIEQFTNTILTRDERDLILSSLERINCTNEFDEQKIKNIINKISEKTIIPADVFTKTGMIGSIETDFDGHENPYLMISTMLNQAFTTKIKELGERNQKKISLPIPLTYKNFKKDITLIEKYTDGIDYFICNSKTSDKLLFLSDWLKYSFLENEDLEDDVIILGKKTEIDKPGVIAIIQVDINNDIIYIVENNVLKINASIFDIGFFPDKCYFTTKLID